MRVMPVVGRTVRDPNSMQLLPDGGRDVPETSYWYRRIRDGDVTLEQVVASGVTEPGDAQSAGIFDTNPPDPGGAPEVDEAAEPADPADPAA